MNEYSRVTDTDIEHFRSIVGPRAMIHGDVEKLEPYSHDETAGALYSHMPEVVLKPESAEEISKILKHANERRIAVTPRGAGSGLSGGAVPVKGGIVLSFERMNRILEIDAANLTITVEPGVVTNDINDAVAAHGLFYAGYPMSLETCFIGGNVAENAGGGKAIKYGVTGRYVYAIEAVLPSGEIVSFGGKRVKDVTGYDLLHLLVGSEGTLAVFTKITLKLVPRTPVQVDLLVLFPDTDSAISAVPRIMVESGVTPTAIEYMDRLSVQTTCKYLNEKLNYSEAGAMLLITMDGHSEPEVTAAYDRVGALCMKCGAIEAYVADNPTTNERVWRIRRNIAEAFKVYSPVQSLEDIVVPFAQIPDLMKSIQELSDRYNVLIPCYGHAGDGNMHATPVKPPEMDENTWEQTLGEILRRLYARTVELGGTISGEHGIGSKRREYLDIAIGQVERALMARIKQAFDPNGILNPGKAI